MNTHSILQGITLILLLSTSISGMENSYTPLVESPADIIIDIPQEEIVAQAKWYEKISQKMSAHKEAVSAIGSAAAALGTNVVFGSANAPAVTIFLGTFGTSVKGILPKSKEHQAIKIGLAALTLGTGVALDYGLSTLAGFDTHWAFSNLALVGGMAAIKRVQKGHFKDKKKKDKKEDKTELTEDHDNQ